MITLTPQQRLILIAAIGSYGIADALETLGVENTPETRKRVKDQRQEIIEACEAADTIAIFTPANMLDADAVELLARIPALDAVTVESLSPAFTRSLNQTPAQFNTERADRGEAALLTTDYDAQDENDRETYMGDVIANLMHLANREGLDFYAALGRGREYYDAEVREEADEKSGK